MEGKFIIDSLEDFLEKSTEEIRCITEKHIKIVIDKKGRLMHLLSFWCGYSQINPMEHKEKLKILLEHEIKYGDIGLERIVYRAVICYNLHMLQSLQSEGVTLGRNPLLEEQLIEIVFDSVYWQTEEFELQKETFQTLLSMGICFMYENANIIDIARRGNNSFALPMIQKHLASPAATSQQKEEEKMIRWSLLF